MKLTIKTTLMILVLATSVLFIANYGMPQVEMVDVNITFENTINDDFLEKIGAQMEHRFESFQGVAVSIPASFVSLLDSSPFVASWEYDTEVEMFADSIDWGVDRINAERVWGGAEDATDVTTSICGSTIKVAVIDTGIDMDHPDLNVVGGYDFVNSDTNPDDDQGHGTHVAGTIAAIDNNAGLVGVAPCVELYGVKVLSSSGSGTSADVAAGIEWAGDNGMDVASLSLGSSSASSTIQSAGEYAASQGVVLVAASGNDGSSTIGYPAAFPEFIAVGATDTNNNKASFSQYGAEQEIMAPGTSIESTYMGGGYTTLQGTSMATPHVSAAAALVLSADNTLTRTEVRTILQDSAIDLGSSGWDSTYGYGLLDAEGAVALATGGGGGGGGSTPGELTNGQTVSSSLSGSSDSETWTIDVAANALSMQVVLNSGSSDYDFFASDQTTSPTHSNNVFEGYTGGGEDVTYNNPSEGTWYIVVDSYSGSGAYDLTVTVTYDSGGGGGSNELTNGQTVTSSLSGSSDSETWTIDVAANAVSMNVLLDSGSSDYDFFASDQTTSPTHSNNVFEGYTGGGEDVTHNNPSAGTWYIVVDSYSGSGSYDLTVTVTYDDGSSDTISLSIYTYDWDISGEVDLVVNGVELNWEAQGVAGDASYKTYNFDITSFAGSSLTITLTDTFGSYTNYFKDLIVYRNGVAESNLESSWVETPGSGVTYTYAL